MNHWHATRITGRSDVFTEQIISHKLCSGMSVRASSFDGNPPEPLFLKRKRWLDVAIALSDRDGTMGECAHRLGVTVDRVRRPILDMTKQGLLLADPVAGERGARYRLREELVARAEREAKSGQQRGAVVAGQPVLLVQFERMLDLADVLRNSELTRSIVWVARLNAGNGYLLVLDGQNTDSITADRLRGAIEAAGGKCIAGRAEAVMGPDEWRQQLAAVREAAL